MGNTVEGVQDVAGGDVEGGLQKTAGGAADGVKGVVDEAGNTVEGVFPAAEGALSLGEGGIVDSTGKLIGQVPEDLQDTLKDTPIKEITSEGQILGEDGGILGKALPPEAKEAVGGVTDQVEGAVGGVTDQAKGVVEGVFPAAEGALSLGEGGIVDSAGKLIGQVPEDLQEKLKDTPIKEITSEGDILGEDGGVLGKAIPPEAQEAVEGVADQAKDAVEGVFPQAEGILNLGDGGNLVDEAGNVIGEVPDDLASKLKDKDIKEITSEGDILDEQGSVLGKASPPSDVGSKTLEKAKSPFPRFKGLLNVDESGKLTDEKGKIIGTVPEDLVEDLQEASIKEITPDGDLIDEDGNNLGKATPPEPLDYKMLEGKKVTKTGKIVDDDGNVVGNLKAGNPKNLEGSICDENGAIWDNKGKKVGQAEPLPKEQIADMKVGPFDDFPDAKVAKNGDIIYAEQVIGKVTEGDPKKLAGKTVDSDGAIVDKNGNVLGRAERWEEPEEEQVDMSMLAGKRVNKAGNVVDSDGSIVGKLVDGDPKKLAGKMCGKNGEVFDEGGNVIGRAELIPPSEREGTKEGPFTPFQPCTVKKDGTVVGPAGNIVGRLIQGDGKVLEGHQVDEDGDVTDKNGNSLGRAERWEPEEVAKDVHPASGLKVNKDGLVINEEGDTIAKLTDGDLNRCRGKKVDDDGDVVDQKGTSIGSVTLIENLKPEKSQEEIDAEQKQKEEEENREKEKKLAKRMCYIIDERMEKINRILKAISDVSDFGSFGLSVWQQTDFALVHQRC